MRNATSLYPIDAAKAAYECFTRGRGNCYTYFAASMVLLTRAGIPNEPVKRHVPGSYHYWNLVNTGSGWYHFDTCPTPGNAVTINQRFMFTQSQAEEYSAVIISAAGLKNYYYVYDKSTVPEAVE